MVLEEANPETMTSEELQEEHGRLNKAIDKVNRVGRCCQGRTAEKVRRLALKTEMSEQWLTGVGLTSVRRAQCGARLHKEVYGTLKS